MLCESMGGSESLRWLLLIYCSTYRNSAAGFGLAMSHDYRVFNASRGYLCMNEIDL